MIDYASKMHHPLARREQPAHGRRPEGERANLDRCLVPYHAKCMRTQSHIEFIYLYSILFSVVSLTPSIEIGHRQSLTEECPQDC